MKWRSAPWLNSWFRGGTPPTNKKMPTNLKAKSSIAVFPDGDISYLNYSVAYRIFVAECAANFCFLNIHGGVSLIEAEPR